MSKDVLMIFIRNPELGKVKTRLAKTIGNHAALRIYELLLQHTFKITKQLRCDKIVYHAEAIKETMLWEPGYQKKVQKGSDLGMRMHNAFKAAFEAHYQKAVIIGSDNYDIKATHIEDAFKMMDTNDIVIGPAADGGYYLLGMKTLHPAIFKEKAWGTATVLAETIKDLKGVSIHLLETLNDIDTYEDAMPVRAFQKFLNHNNP